MNSSRNRIFVLFLMTLLQCFAPLLHAHAHGISVEGKVHMHGGGQAPMLASLHHEHPELPSFVADRDEAPVIAMAQEFRHDSSIFLSDPSQPTLTKSIPEFSIVRSDPVVPACVASRGGHFRHFLPFPQAPPSSLI